MRKIMGKKQALERIANALERMSPPDPKLPDFNAPAYLWDNARKSFEAVTQVQTAPLDCLVGIDRARDNLLANTIQFARGKAANNALLWGARGMGKSSLIKAVFENVRVQFPLTLIEVSREDLGDIGMVMRLLRTSSNRIILFCDDLSFEYDEAIYKSLKAALDGGIAGKPDNVIFYASSNRRHLMARDMIENERQAAIHEGEAIEEKISLSDRFGLWLGFYGADQDQYFEMIRRYLSHFGAHAKDEDWMPEAIEWTMTRGGRSGRVAWQFVTDFLGK